MKKNKGIILSSYIYILLVFFLLVLSVTLLILNNTRLLSNDLDREYNKNNLFSIVYEVLVISRLSSQEQSTHLSFPHIPSQYPHK